MTKPLQQEETMKGNHALFFVLITVLLDVIGLGIVIPVTPKLIVELTHQGFDRAAVYGGWLFFLYALGQFFAGPILGSLSDRIGRRPVLLVSLLAFGADYLFMGFAQSFVWLVVGRCVAGIASATYSVVSAYIADISPPEDRAKNFGYLGVAWGVGFILGPVIGGFLGEMGSRVPFFVAGAITLANAIYGYFVLPESLAKSARREFSWQRANPFGSIGAIAKYPVVKGLFAVLVLTQLAHDAMPSIWTFYTQLKFGWTERDVGASMGFMGLCIAIVQGGAVGPAVKRFGERNTVHIGFFCMALCFLGYAFASAGWMMYAFSVLFAFEGLQSSTLRAILSNQVSDSEQGEMQGALTGIQSLTSVVGPLLMTQLFGFFSTSAESGVRPFFYFPGAAFFASFVLICIAWAFFAWKKTPNASPKTSLPS